MSVPRGEEGKGISYRDTGVDHESEDSAMSAFLRLVRATADFPDDAGKPLCEVGFFASVIRLTDDLGLAVCADGVGTKILLAQQMHRYDTIGIDCIAMNVNDLVCIGARPIAFLDYIAVQKLDAEVLEQIGRGLHDGAKTAGVSIPGGELAQVREMLRGVRSGSGLDLVGMAVGLVAPDDINLGDDIREGDPILGIRSAGVHSNGFTLARHICFERMKWMPNDRPQGLERTVGEELLEPTRIYVPHVRDLAAAGIRPRGLAHITGGGLLNLARFRAECGFHLDALPDPPPIFHLLKRCGEVSDEEMYRVFNMGIGFCVVVAPEDEAKAVDVLRRRGHWAGRIGTCIRDPQRKVSIPRLGLVGLDDRFTKNTG
jgi:phosphoribosylformylglycinamidine cyclo-ligase